MDAESIVSGYKVGDRVRTVDNVLPKRFAGKSGTVVSLNVSDGEIGLTFSPLKAIQGPLAEVLQHEKAQAWFVPGELVRRGSQKPIPEQRCRA